MPKGNNKGYIQQHGAGDQPTGGKTDYIMNMPGGGTYKQGHGSQNKPCKPAVGTQGQKAAGKVRGARTAKGYASDR